ncbi:MAG: translation elongation factor Ts [Beijerinckiaceae bacterium]
MAEITAALVKELRDKTDAGMMDCKKALMEVGGDIEAGIDWLRKNGLSKAAKKSDRIAAEGLVGLIASGTMGTVVEVNSETDFVAKNDTFQGLVRAITSVAAKTGTDVEAIKAAAYPTGGTVSEAIANAIATVGENMSLRRAASLSVKSGVVASYIHTAINDSMGRIGVLVALESTGKADELAAFGRQVAMHVAATNPQALDGSGVDPSVIAREKNLLMEKNAGKPANVMEKIIESGLKSYFKEVTLLDQSFVIDPSKTVAQAAKEMEGKAGAPVVIAGFIRYALGEGIEKKQDDFAAEVAAAAKG